MILKEYRILLPLSVEEYRIAQLYMIAKKSQTDSKGAGSGVEILKNEPYKNGPGGTSGQYTYKIFHVGNHLPNWFRSILPKSALIVEEEAWNAYPYTKTRYSCPFVERLTLEIETRYYNDAGTKDNVFELNKQDLKDRQIDYMNIVLDEVSPMHYVPEEDPRIYHSEKTGRGPLTDDWVNECGRAGRPLMCAYKLCRVEFKYWGLQTRIENFIHDVALRRTMVHAHRQAWAWQDEWYGMTLDDIRRMEAETQRMLQQLMHQQQTEGDEDTLVPSMEESPSPVKRDTILMDKPRRPVSPSGSQRSCASALDAIRAPEDDAASVYFDALDDEDRAVPPVIRWNSMEMLSPIDDFDDASNLTPPTSPVSKIQLLIMVLHAGTPLDAHAQLGKEEGALFASPDVMSAKLADIQTLRSTIAKIIDSQYENLSDRVAIRLVPCVNFAKSTLAALFKISPLETTDNACAGICHPALVATLAEQTTAYDEAVEAATQRCNNVYDEFINSEENRHFSGEIYLIGDSLGGLIAYDLLTKNAIAQPTTPGALSVGHLYVSRNASSVSAHSDSVSRVIPENEVVDDNGNDHVFPEQEGVPQLWRLKNDDKVRRSSSVSDAGSECSNSSVRVAQHYHAQTPAANNKISEIKQQTRQSSSPLSNKGSTPVPQSPNPQLSQSKRYLSFKCHTLFLFGSPLSPILSQRKVSEPQEPCAAPAVEQVFNMYYSIDPCAARIEPLFSKHLVHLPAMDVPRYVRHPLGDGQPLDIGSYLSRHRQELTASISHSHASLHATLHAMSKGWWGEQRCDFALYCPEGVASFPTAALPSLLHASYWESVDVCSFIMRHFVCRHSVVNATDNSGGAPSITDKLGLLSSVRLMSDAATPAQPGEKWLRKRTSFKTKSAVPNHRANDVIVKEEDTRQTIQGKFMYGPFDVVTLSGEKVDIYVRVEHEGSYEVTDATNSPASVSARQHASTSNVPASAKELTENGHSEMGEWHLVGTEVTDAHGRCTFTFANERRLPVGVHSVRMLVRGDGTYLDMSLAVVPEDTQAVVFSIDGSFTASMSVTGRDPRVRPGAVDIVRHWQERGYLILYMTARPDFQQRQVVSWLAQHNFPHGLMFFVGAFSTEPLKHKAMLLQKLVTECGITVRAAYGSAKDVFVYLSANIAQDRIFVVGKCAKKQLAQCCHLADGYSAHLSALASDQYLSHAVCPAAHNNARLGLVKQTFQQHAQPSSKQLLLARRAAQVHRSHSFTPRSGKLTSACEQAIPIEPVRHKNTQSSLTVETPVASPRTRGFSPFRKNERR